MKVKKFCIAAMFFLLPSVIFALGLGEIKVSSYLNQPFDAEIPLLGVGGMPLNSIKVAVASPEDFERVGMELNEVLSYLQFNVTRRNGRAVIRITSSERITEPYLELLVDMAWPSGQLFRKYTVLLDPASYDLNQKIKVKGYFPGYHHEGKSVVQQTVIDEPVYLPVPEKPVNKTLKRSSATYGPTLANENIREIAQRYAKGDSTMAQVVLAIVGTNSQAFTQGNLNGLKTGVMLRIPSMDEILSVPAELAKREMEAHDAAWKDNKGIVHVLLPPYINTGTGVSQVVPAMEAAASKAQTQDETTRQPYKPVKESTGTNDLTTAPELNSTPSMAAPVVTQAVPVQRIEDKTIYISYLPVYPVLKNTDISKPVQKATAPEKNTVAQVKNNIKQTTPVPVQEPMNNDDSSSVWIYALPVLALLAVAFFIYQRRRQQSELSETTGWVEPVAIEPEIHSTPVEIIAPIQPEEPFSEIVQESGGTPTVQSEVEDLTEPEVQPELDIRTERELPPEPELQTEEIPSASIPKQIIAPVSVAMDELPEIEAAPQSDENYLMDFESGLDKFISPYNSEEDNLEDKNLIPPAEKPVKKVKTEKVEEALKLVKSRPALSTLLDLAKTYISMEDFEAARQSLQEVSEFGDKKQKQEAQKLLDEIRDK